MPAVTANSLIESAFGLLNITMPGENPSANDATFALGVLNRMVSSWRQRAILVPVVARERFDLVADQGGPTDPYTIGTGGDFNTDRPVNQNAIQSANLILTATDPEVRVPLGIYTDQAYDANQLPGMSNSQPTSLYYNPTYADGLGSIYLWPVPNTSTNDLELFLLRPLSRFADLTTEYDVPDGYDDALVYNLEQRLASPFGRQVTPADQALAVESLGVIKRSNAKLSDLQTDAFWATYGRGTLYNIQTGNM